MSIPTIINLVILLVALLSLGAFGAGVALGVRKTESRRPAASVLALSALTLVGFALIALPLARRMGPLVMVCAILFAGAITNGMLGGFIAGLRRRRGQSLWNGSTLATFLLIALFLGYANARLKEVEKVVTTVIDTGTKVEPEANKDCPENLKSLYLALASYAKDWDALPPPSNWMDNEEIVSKVTKNEWLHCPAVSNRQDDKFGYAYNEALAGKSLQGKELKEMPDAAKTPLIYDSNTLSKNAHDAQTSLPTPGRHGGRNNILYCDGHVEAAERR